MYKQFNSLRNGKYRKKCRQAENRRECGILIYVELNYFTTIIDLKNNVQL